MSFLNQLQNQKNKLKDTETVVTNADGSRFLEKSNGNVSVPRKPYGFIVDTKPDDTPALVIDHLYIGSQDCIAKPVLEKFNIKSVLSVGIEMQVTDVTHKYVACLDLPETNIKPILHDSLPFVREAIENKQNVLIHCNAGVSRTSMVAIAYLILYKGMMFTEAYGLVKSKRPAIQPNAGFTRQLKVMKPEDYLNLNK